MSFTRSWMSRRLALAIALAVTVVAASVSTVSARSVSHAGSRSATGAGLLRARLAAAPSAGPVLGGITSQGWPAVMALSRNGKRIVFAEAAVVMSCTSGDQFVVPEGFAGIPIRNGKVHAVAAIPPDPGAQLVGGSHSLSGRFDRTRSSFRGTWHLHLTFQTSGPQNDECDSGQVALAAR